MWLGIDADRMNQLLTAIEALPRADATAIHVGRSQSWLGYSRPSQKAPPS
jgi:hypothetical protein